MQITAALTYAPDAPFEIQDVELDDPRDDEILVRMVAAGICHTDLGVKAAWPADAGPLVLGHEGAGVVEAVGAGVSGYEPGDHVLLSYRSCRELRQLPRRPRLLLRALPRAQRRRRAAGRLDHDAPRRHARARQLLRPVELRHPRTRLRE